MMFGIIAARGRRDISGKTILAIAVVAGTGILQSGAQAQKPADTSASGVPSPQPDPTAPQAPGAPAAPDYDHAIFEKPLSSDRLAFLNGFRGAGSGDLFRDKEFHKILQAFLPGCMFHYGRDMPLSEAIEMVFSRSPIPVQVRESRYVALYSHGGPYLGGRALLWIDMKDGIGVGAFFFHPTNGEPTPTVTVFSKQVRENFLKMSQLPPAFAEDLYAWLAQSRISPVSARYFIGGPGKRILLEHDEEYCAPANGAIPPPDCQQMDADAADSDLNAAYYLEHVHYASNATAWMISGDDRVAWIRFRESSCRIGPDPLACRIRITRERTRMIVTRRAAPANPRR
jgi:uncharacterized protein YecT (DUF1311 family)